MARNNHAIIAKIVTGKGFKGALSYILDKDEGQFIYGQGVFSKKPEEIALAMRQVSRGNSRATKPVFHASLSIRDGRATNAQWRTAAETYLKKMGFDLDQTQYVLVRHQDTKHDHVHIIANRVQLNSKLVSSRHNFKLSQEAAAEASIASGLDLDREWHRGSRMDVVRIAADKALAESVTFEDFKKNLKDSGIEVRSNIGKSGFATLSYVEADGRWFRASDLGRSYTVNGLAKRGLDMDALMTRKPRVAVHQAKELLRGLQNKGQRQPATNDKKQRYEQEKWLAERGAENAKTEAEQARKRREAEHEDEDEL